MTQAFLRYRPSTKQLARSVHGDRTAVLVPLWREVGPIGFSPNATIYREGDPADRLYKVISGTVRTCKVLLDGRRQIGGFYLPSETLGLETEANHRFSAEAITDSEVLIIGPRIFSAARCEVDAPFEMCALMSRELRRTQDHALLLGKTAPERVATFLLEMADRLGSADPIELPMPRPDIAAYLGLTVETVSRMLTQLENQSIIALSRSRRIVLRKRAALHRIAVCGS